MIKCIRCTLYIRPPEDLKTCNFTFWSLVNFNGVNVDMGRHWIVNFILVVAIHYWNQPVEILCCASSPFGYDFVASLLFPMKTQPTIVLHLHIVLVSFSFRFQQSTQRRWKLLKRVKTSRYLLFTCQDNLNNLWLLLHRFQKFAFSVKTIRLHDNDIIITISFSNFFTLETIFKSYRFQ